MFSDDDMVQIRAKSAALVRVVLDSHYERQQIDARGGRLVDALPRDQWLIVEASCIGSAQALPGSIRISTPGHKISTALMCYIWGRHEVSDVYVNPGEDLFTADYIYVETTDEVATIRHLAYLYASQIWLGAENNGHATALQILIGANAE